MLLHEKVLRFFRLGVRVVFRFGDDWCVQGQSWLVMRRLVLVGHMQTSGGDSQHGAPLQHFATRLALCVFADVQEPRRELRKGESKAPLYPAADSRYNH